MRLFRGQGDGDFVVQSTLGKVEASLSVAVADLDGDDRADIVIEDGIGSVSIYLGT